MIIKEVIATGKDVSEAQENARLALGADPLAEVQYDIIYAGKKGFLGFMSKPAQVRAYIESTEENETAAEPRRERRERRDRRPKNNNNQSNRKNENKKPKAEKKPEAIKEPIVTSESTLKFEKREVSVGEDMSFDFVSTLISNIGLNAEATLYSVEDGTRRITITGEDATALIGHHGDTLDALQYLANLASAKKNANGERDKSRVTIDIEGYRAKREETLRALARRMAAKALRNKRSVMLEPMSAYERRIIHSEVQGIEGVSTNSVGSDNNRKIVIYLTEKKPKELFDEDEQDNTIKAQTTSRSEITEDDVLNAPVIDSLATAELSEEEAAAETVAVEHVSETEEAEV